MNTTKTEKVDIVFINPPLSHEERYGIKFKIGGQTPPTGLAMLAAVARKNNYTTRIIDSPALNFSFEEVAKKALGFNPKYVGLTAVTISIFNTIKVAKLIKEKNQGIIIILGGPHITAAPYETFEKFGEFIDIAIIGEGESTLTYLLNALEKKQNLKDVKGIIYKERGKLVTTPPQEIITKLDKLPIPAWDLLPELDKYYHPPVHNLRRLPAALLITSRGCPQQCIFCDKKVFGKVYRSHSPKYIIYLMKFLKTKYGIKEIEFKDDNLFANKRGLKKLCRLIIKEDLGIIWSCSGRVDMIDLEILALMKKAGCWQIWYGIESGSDKVLKASKKNISVDKIKKAINWTRQAEISPAGFFMIGMPKETEEDIKKTIDLLLELPLNEFHVNHLTPLPGSEIYKCAEDYGTVNREWKKMNFYTSILFVPEGLTDEKLRHYSNLAFKKFFLRPRIIFNYLTKIKSPTLFKIYFEAFIGFLIYILKRRRN